MRLLDSTTLEFREFIGEQIPPYAILSHTWREKELSFQDMQSRCAHKKEYDKVKHFCETAAAHGFGYVWMDTCCIDKSSSSELSEAINSMYRWYQEAEVCYVYLSDVPSGTDSCGLDPKFAGSRWFTRGWTLQELIAPSSVIFLGSDWEEIGTKGDLQEVISEITGIHANILLGDDDLESVSIAQRMSWASKRTTTRVEDLAYCLMGVFGVNMPMLYGEGQQAFIRLQEEIMKMSDDHSIFAWKSNDWWRHDGGLLATSPAAFIGSGDIIRSSQMVNGLPFTVTNKGIHLQLPLIAQNQPKTSLAVLNCQRIGKGDQLLGIMLRSVSETEECFERDLTYEIKTTGTIEGTLLDLKSIYVRHKRLARRRNAASYNQCSIKAEGIEKHGFFLCETYPLDCWIKPDGVTSEIPHGDDIFGAIKFADGHGYAFSVILKKKGKLLCANVITNVRSEPLKEIVLSLRPNTTQSECRRREWRNEPDRIFRPYLSGRICIAIRKQIIFQQKHFVVDISFKDTLPNRMKRQRVFTF
jgi:hypothetical protein